MKVYTIKQVSPKTCLVFSDKGGSLAKNIIVILSLPKGTLTGGKEKIDVRRGDYEIHTPWIKDIFDLEMGITRITAFSASKKLDQLKLEKNIKEGHSWQEIISRILWILRIHFHPDEGYKIEELLHGVLMKKKGRDKEYIEVD